MKMLFLARVVHLCVCGVLLTKEKVVRMILCMNYVVKIPPKTPFISRFLGRMFKFLCTDVLFPQQKYDIGRIFRLTSLF